MVIVYRRCCRIWPIVMPDWAFHQGHCGICGEVPEEVPTDEEIAVYLKEREDAGS